MRAFPNDDELENSDPQTAPELNADARLAQVATLLARGLARHREARLTAGQNSPDSASTCLEQSPPALLTVMDG